MIEFSDLLIPPVIGLAPVFGLVWGIMAVVKKIFRGELLLSPADTFPVTAVAAFAQTFFFAAVGLKHPADHHTGYLFAATIMSTIFWIPFWICVFSRNRFDAERIVDIRTQSINKKLQNLMFSLVFLLITITVYHFLEELARNPKECTRVGCEAGVFVVGSQFYPFGFFWFFLVFTNLGSTAAVANALALFLKTRDNSN